MKIEKDCRVGVLIHVVITPENLTTLLSLPAIALLVNDIQFNSHWRMTLIIPNKND